MSQQIFIDGIHDYDYESVTTSEGVWHILKRSHGEGWYEHVRGEVLYSILDDGNGFKFDQKIKKNLDYHEAFSLSVILKKISFNECTVEITKLPVIEPL